MVHISKINPTSFGGSASPWATSLAHWSATELVISGSNRPFFASHPQRGATCLIAPAVESGCVRWTCFYGLKKRAFNLASLSGDLAINNVAAWRDFARAFVSAEYSPTLNVTNHDASIRASVECLLAYHVRAPSLCAVDYALGSSLTNRMNAQEQELIRKWDLIPA